MVRTQIQLRDEQAEQLRMLAAREEVSLAELIRRGVDMLLAQATGSERRGRLDALRVAGLFDSGVPGVARRHDEELNEAYVSDPRKRKLPRK